MSDKKNFKFFHNKKIAFLGLGEENFSLLKFLIKKGVAESFTICDPKNEGELGLRWEMVKRLAQKNDFTVCRQDGQCFSEKNILCAQDGSRSLAVARDDKNAQDGSRSLAVARDDKNAQDDKRKKIIFISGNNYDKNLTDFDIIFRSPGYPLFSKNLIKAKKAGVIISSPMKLFFELCPTKNIIGVTGSKGKGTTASLIYEVLKTHLKAMTHPDASRNYITPPAKGGLGGVWLGGNIGIAPFDFMDKIKSGDFVVLELSSFQLEDLDKSPHIAVITNIFKEHLASADPANPNYHKSMKAYWEAKANIFKHQKKNDYLVVNEKLKDKIFSFCHSDPLRAERNLSQSTSDAQTFSKKGIRSAQDGGRSLTVVRDDNGGKTIFYDKSNLPSNLIGEHNQKNIAAAEAVAKILKIKPEIVARAVKKFKGLPHRLEKVAEKNGVKYFDDSFATVPEVSVIALNSFSNVIASEATACLRSFMRRGKQSCGARDKTSLLRPPAIASETLRAGRLAPRNDKNIILLAGGADKGSDFKEFVKEINKKVKYLILFKGKGTDLIKKEIKSLKLKIQNSVVDNMREAIRIAKGKVKPGDIVLLSAGCASFGCFKNYKDRGDQFKREIKK